MSADTAVAERSSNPAPTKKRPRSGEFLEGTSTTFTVEEVIRAGGGYRPSFRFRGHVTKGPQPNNKGQATDPDAVPNLHLVLRYEPPSPKFKRSNPGSVSYRMQVEDGDDFLFSMRGLPAELHVDKAAKMLAWGRLGIIFAVDDHLEQFLTTIKYVEITHTSTPTKTAAKALPTADSSGLQSSLSNTSLITHDSVHAELRTLPSLKLFPTNSMDANPLSKQGTIGAPAKPSHSARPAWGLLAAVGAAVATALLFVHKQRGGRRG